MDKNGLRTGRVSSVNYKEGKVRVVYPDRDNSVTIELPVLNFNDEYKMPTVDSTVAVMHLSNGTSMAVCFGNMWSEESQPPESGEKLYRKDYSRKPGDAYSRYDDDLKEMTHFVENGIAALSKAINTQTDEDTRLSSGTDIYFHTGAVSTSVNDIIARIERLEHLAHGH